jgi:flavin-dependent dehydrogenase
VVTKNVADSLQESLVQTSEKPALELRDGSRVAVIGGGPAGSLFSYFLLHMAGTVSLNLEVDIYEPRYFIHKGPAGCNHCGGVVSETLVQRLATEGINLPPSIVQRGIDSYTLHMDVGSVRIDTPLHEMRIAAVYRGNGPRNSELMDTVSFDGYLQEHAIDAGARVVRRLVSDLQRDGQVMRVVCPDGYTSDYDLVVVATGVNSRFLEMAEALSTDFRHPETAKTFICEFPLDQFTIQESLGTSMHVFLLDLPRLEFAALIPKGEYVTMCLLGDEIDEELVEAFLGATEVRQRFPTAIVPPNVCHCFPRINVASAVHPFGDRLVMIGDSGTTRLFKDGIGAAYRTAKAAAKTAIFHGVSADDFRDHYLPVCKNIEFDNGIGKLVFGVSRQMQKMRFARRAILRMTASEQKKTKGRRRMSEVLWDLFTGSAPYRDVFLRTLHPVYLSALLWNLVASNWPLARRKRLEQAGAK